MMIITTIIIITIIIIIFISAYDKEETTSGLIRGKKTDPALVCPPVPVPGSSVRRCS